MALIASTMGTVLGLIVLVVVLVFGGMVLSRSGLNRGSEDDDARHRREADRGFRKPPDEGGLL